MWVSLKLNTSAVHFLLDPFKELSQLRIQQYGCVSDSSVDQNIRLVKRLYHNFPVILKKMFFYLIKSQKNPNDCIYNDRQLNTVKNRKCLN